MSNPIPIYIERHEPESGKQRVAAYCRVSSSSDEQMHSYLVQVNNYKKQFSEDDSFIFVGAFGVWISMPMADTASILLAIILFVLQIRTIKRMEQQQNLIKRV